VNVLFQAASFFTDVFATGLSPLILMLYNLHMPEDMSKETSSIDYMRSLGQPHNLPSMEESRKAAQEFPQPAAKVEEFKKETQEVPQPMAKKEMPDIRMQLGGKDEEPNHSTEDAAASRMYYRSGESLNSELISSAEEPAELFMGLRGLERMLEDTVIPVGLNDRYTPPRDEAIMYEKARNLGISIKELNDLEIIKKDTYNEKDGTGQPKKRKYASLCLSVDEDPIKITDKNGKERTIGMETVFRFGTPKEREEMSKAYDIASKELAVRDIIGEHIGLRMNEEIRDSYEEMSRIMHSGRVPKFTTEHLQTLFNLPSTDELRNGKEIEKSHELGDQIEKGMFCHLVMLASNSKERMLELLDRPGSIHLITKMAKEHEEVLQQEKKDNSITYGFENWIADNIGDVHNWVDDDKRKIGETWREEREKGKREQKEQGYRTGLAEWSNIAAWEGNSGEFGEDKEHSYIEKTVGGLIGSVEAAWVSTSLLRAIGAFSSEGYAALPDGTSLLPLGDDRYISGDDFGKAYAYMFNYKEGTKGRPSGLKGMIGKIPDLAMNLFDWAQVEMTDLPKNPDGSFQRRSIIDAWLGTKEQPKRSLKKEGEWAEITDPQRIADGEGVKMLVGKIVDGKWRTVEKVFEGKVEKEEYHRLGSLNFKSLPKRFHGTYTIMQWLMGNREGPTGVNIEALNVDFRVEDFRLHALKKIKKYIGIVMNAVVLTKGSPHLYTDPAGDAKIIQKNYFRNLMLARIQSESFSRGILNSKERLFTPKTGGEVEVPVPVLIRASIKEALKPNPDNEEDLIKRYLDENERLRTLGKDGTPGLKEDVSTLLREKFEPEPIDNSPEAIKTVQKEKENTKYVGIVRGRRKS